MAVRDHRTDQRQQSANHAPCLFFVQQVWLGYVPSIGGRQCRRPTLFVSVGLINAYDVVRGEQCRNGQAHLLVELGRHADVGKVELADVWTGVRHQ